MEICNEVFRKNPDINYGSNRPDYQNGCKKYYSSVSLIGCIGMGQGKA